MKNKSLFLFCWKESCFVLLCFRFLIALVWLMSWLLLRQTWNWEYIATGASKKEAITSNGQGLIRAHFVSCKGIEIKPIYPLVAINKCMGLCDLFYSTVSLLNNFPQSFRWELWKPRIRQMEALPRRGQGCGHPGSSSSHTQAPHCPRPAGWTPPGSRSRCAVEPRGAWGGDRECLASLFPCCALVFAPAIHTFLVLVIRSSGEAKWLIFIYSLPRRNPSLPTRWNFWQNIIEVSKIMNAELGL